MTNAGFYWFNRYQYSLCFYSKILFKLIKSSLIWKYGISVIPISIKIWLMFIITRNSAPTGVQNKEWACQFDRRTDSTSATTIVVYTLTERTGIFFKDCNLRVFQNYVANVFATTKTITTYFASQLVIIGFTI